MPKNGGWNPWKMTAIGMALVVVTALVTGLVVANWAGHEADTKPAAPMNTQSTSTPPRTAKMPTQNAIDSCNQYAAQQAGTHDKTKEVVKDAAIGAVVGAAVGAAGGAIADGGKGAGKGAAIGGVAGVGAGTLYGLNENRKNDQRYRDAYAACMRSRGHAG